MFIGENIDKTIIYDEIRDFIEVRYVGSMLAHFK